MGFLFRKAMAEEAPLLRCVRETCFWRRAGHHVFRRADLLRCRCEGPVRSGGPLVPPVGAA